MVRLNIIYITVISILLLFSGCDSLIYDDHDNPQAQQPVVYLSITKAQAAGLTLNADNVDYEDRVHDLAMLVFDSSTGAKIGEHFDENIPFSEKEKIIYCNINSRTTRFLFCG